jgi:hypothetical protein
MGRKLLLELTNQTVMKVIVAAYQNRNALLWTESCETTIENKLHAMIGPR